MTKNNSRGLLHGLLYFAAGTVAGTLLAIGLHTWMSFISGGGFEAAYLWDLPSWLLGAFVGLLAFLYGLVGYYGVVRGLVWQIIGTLLGAGFVTLMSLLLNLFL